MNIERGTPTKWRLEELFKQAEQVRTEMQRAEKWIQNREDRLKQCNQRTKDLEADGAPKGKIQVQKEIVRKVQVGIRIARDDLNRKQSEMHQCLNAMRELITDNQSALAKIKKDKLLT
jgi:hypothetical protein